MDAAGELPGEVGRVEHARVDRDPARGEQVRRVAGQEDAAFAVGVRLLRGVAEPCHPQGLSQRQVDAEHAAHARAQLRDGHGHVVVVLGGLHLGGVDAHGAAHARAREHATFGRGVAERDLADSRDVESPVVEHGHRVGHGDRGQALDLRERRARERDAGQLADPAAAAVAAHQEVRCHRVGSVRATHLDGHRVVVLVQPDHLVSPAYVATTRDGAFGEDGLEPGLGQQHRAHRWMLERR